MKAGCNTTAEVVSAVFIIMSSIFGLFILTIFAFGNNQRNHIKLNNIFQCLKKTDDNDEMEPISNSDITQESQQSNREDKILKVKLEVQEIEITNEEKLSRSEELKFALMKQVSKFRERNYQKEKRNEEETNKENDKDEDIQKGDSEVKDIVLEEELNGATSKPDGLKLVNGIKNAITHQVTKFRSKSSSKEVTDKLSTNKSSSTIVNNEINEQKQPDIQDK